MTFELAQLNVGRTLGAMDDPVMAEFAANLDRINALAESSPGFVWRLQSDAGNATDIRVGDDDRFLVNLSVWRDLASLKSYVYRTAHAGFLRRRREWFERMEDAHLVLWWVAAGHRPSTDEALDRLQRLRRDGPTADAFTLLQPFPAPGQATAAGAG